MNTLKQEGNFLAKLFSLLLSGLQSGNGFECQLDVATTFEPIMVVG